MDFVQLFIVQILLPPAGYKQSINLCGQGGDGKTLIATEFMKMLGVKYGFAKSSDTNGIGFGKLVLGKDAIVLDEADFNTKSIRGRLKDLGDATNPSTINVGGSGQVHIDPMLTYATSNPEQMLPNLYLGDTKELRDRNNVSTRKQMGDPERNIIRRFLPVWMRGTSATPYEKPFQLQQFSQEVISGFKSEIGNVVTYMIQRYIALGHERFKEIASRVRKSSLYYMDRWFDQSISKVSYVIYNHATGRVYSTYVVVGDAQDLSSLPDGGIDTLALVGDKEYHYNYDGVWHVEHNDSKFFLPDGVLETLGYVEKTAIEEQMLKITQK